MSLARQPFVLTQLYIRTLAPLAGLLGLPVKACSSSTSARFEQDLMPAWSGPKPLETVVWTVVCQRVGRASKPWYRREFSLGMS